MMSPLPSYDFATSGNAWELSMLQLKEAPVEELRKHKRATRIDLSNNLFISLPESFTELVHIVELDLSGNRLASLPQNFGLLRNLTKLDLYNNQLRLLPLSFSRLTNLKWLDLKDNPLDETYKAAAGDCKNAHQCKKCAKQMVKLVKQLSDRFDELMSEKLSNEEKKSNLNEDINDFAEEEDETVKQKKKGKKKKKAKKATEKNIPSEFEGPESSLYEDYHEEEQRISSWSISGICSNLLCWSLFLAFLIVLSSIGLWLWQGKPFPNSLSKFEECLNNLAIILEETQIVMHSKKLLSSTFQEIKRKFN